MAEAPKSGKKSQGKLVIAGAIVGLLAYLWWKRKQAASAQSGGAIGTLPPAMPGGAESSTTQIGGSGTPSFNSITDWMSHVQTWGNSLGFDAATTQSALQAYSTGECLSGTQYKIIDQALGLFGMPPQAPYQGVVQCNPTQNATTVDQGFFGVGYGPLTSKDWQNSSELLPVSGTDGMQYEWLPSSDSVSAAIKAGVPVYYQPTPGVFKRSEGINVANTPTFIQGGQVPVGG